jgi:hypothetical protein
MRIVLFSPKKSEAKLIGICDSKLDRAISVAWSKIGASLAEKRYQKA